MTIGSGYWVSPQTLSTPLARIPLVSRSGYSKRDSTLQVASSFAQEAGPAIVVVEGDIVLNSH